MERLSRWPGVLVATALLSACATSMQSVADFGAAANRVAVDFKPLARGPVDACRQYLRYRALGASGPFDEAAVARSADLSCDHRKEDAKTALFFAQALGDYATALTRLAKARPTAFDKDLKGVGSAVGGLEDRQETAYFDGKKVAAATKIARAAAALALAGRSRQLTRAELVDNHAALVVVVQAMWIYAEGVYESELHFNHIVIKGELDRLVAASNAPTQDDVEARLPWRYAQAGARADLAANELEARRIQAFRKAAVALIAAHQALIDGFDKLGGPERLALVAEFVTQAQAFADDVDTL